jgi:hypothetical protein
MWPGQIERCKMAIASALACGPLDVRTFDHKMLHEGWTSEELAAARSSLGVVEASTLVLPNGGRCRMIAMPRQIVPPVTFTGRVSERATRSARPRMGGRRVS